MFVVVVIVVAVALYAFVRLCEVGEWDGKEYHCGTVLKRKGREGKEGKVVPLTA